MTYFTIIVSFLSGFVFGRVYGWMKYHQPEFQEAIKAKAAKFRAERARYEADEERARGMIDDEIERRMLQ
jgi:hypothetical protein